MKSSISEWLFNPFKRIAGFEAFIAGLIIAVSASLIGSYSGISFDGAIDVHPISVSISKSLIYTGIDIIVLVLTMYVAGLTVAKGFRFVDMLGTLTLARAPYMILALSGFLVSSPDIQQIIDNPMILFQSAGFILMMIITIPVTIWVIVLMYNAFKITTGAKGSNVNIAFIIAILMAELISKLIIIFLV